MSSTSVGSTSAPAAGGTNSGGAPTRVATTDRPAAMPSRSARPERLDQARLADDVGARDPLGDLVVSDAPGDGHAGAALDGAAQRPVADERQRARADPLEGVRQAHDVLPLDQRPDAEVRVWPSGAGSTRNRSRSTPQSTTSTLPRASGTFVSSSWRR